MSVLPQLEDSHTLLAEQYSASSSPHSTSSKRSSRNWYHHTPNPSVPRLAAGRHLNRLRGISSVKELARKTSRSVLNQTLFNRQTPSLNEIDFDQRHDSVIHLPGSPQGPTCRPPALVGQDSTDSSLDSLTPDQSGISNVSSEPITPPAAQATRSLLDYRKATLGSDMGNIDSRLVGTKVGKAILRSKKSQQTIELESSAKPSTFAEQASEQPTKLEPDQTTKEASGLATELGNEDTKGNADPDGPPPVLRHRASYGQLQVPRRRSSLTALHLDSSHFENSSLSTNSDRDNRVSGFRASFHPVISSPNATTVVQSPLPQGNKSSYTPSPQLLSPSSSKSQSWSTNSKLPLSTTPKRAQPYFPKTWPDGPPESKPAQLTPSHYECYRLHQPIRREKAMSNQVPCMACGIDDKQQRFSCMWCELRLCERCMKQLDSTKGRPLTTLIDWVAQTKERTSARFSKDPSKVNAGDNSEQWRSDERLKKVQSTERAELETKGNESVKKIKIIKLSRSPSQNQTATKDANDVDLHAKKTTDEWWLVRKANSLRKAAMPAEHTNPAPRAKEPESPTKGTNNPETSTEEQAARP